MTKLLILLVLAAIWSITSHADSGKRPVCVAIGTRSEAWLIPGERRMRFANCADQIAACGAIGTRSEGWYIYEKRPEGPLKYDNCADTEISGR